MATESSDGGAQPAPSDRRRWQRVPVTPPDSDDKWIRIIGVPAPIIVLDISRGGIRFTAAHVAKTGDVLVVWLYNQALGSWLKAQVRVVHVSGYGQGAYQIGGEFSQPISEAELQGFLGGPVVPTGDGE